jgi:hypothetical protein
MRKIHLVPTYWSFFEVDPREPADSADSGTTPPRQTTASSCSMLEIKKTPPQQIR